MQKSFVLMGAAVLSAMLSSGTMVRANPVPWAYIAQSTTIYNTNNLSQSSSIQFNGVSGAPIGDSSAGNLTGVILYNLTTTSSADAPGDSFVGSLVTLSATLTDLNSTLPGAGTAIPSAPITLTGHLTAKNVTKFGNISPANIVWDASSTNSVLLGSDNTGWYTYTATPGNYVVPQPNFDPNKPGSLQLLVTITPSNGPTGTGVIPDPPSPSPEPASLVLAGCGLPLFWFARRRLKKSPAPTTAA